MRAGFGSGASLMNRRVAARLTDAGRVVGIEVLDHVVVGDGRFVSLRGRGALAG